MRRRGTIGRRRFSLSTRRLRRILSWKFVFYDLLMPALARLGSNTWRRDPGISGPAGDGIATSAAKTTSRGAVARSAALDADWSIETTWPALAANTARFLARDYPIDRQSDEAVLSRFDVHGYERLNTTLACGRGAILVGSHLGAHIAGVHWLFRRGVPLRLLVQRPRHVSRELNRRFDDRNPHPQGEMFLRRDLSPAVAIERVFRARAALRDGLAIYLNGDIPWVGPEHVRRVCCWAAPQRFLAIWTELAVLTSAPGLPGVLHPPARWPIRARDRSNWPLASRRGGHRSRRLPQTARGPNRDQPGRRRCTPGLALLPIASVDATPAS